MKISGKWSLSLQRKLLDRYETAGSAASELAERARSARAPAFEE